jgi:hypothetical protein
MRLICIIFLISVSLVIQVDILFAEEADILFNTADSSSQLMGFGAQIWSGDTRIESILTSLPLKYVRMKFGGSWAPPTDATQAQMDAYVASQYDGNASIRTTYAMLNRLGIKVIANQFEGPPVWLGSGNRLNSANFDDMARLWGSIAYYMQDHNMPISYIEMFNEPEGNWNIYVPGADYNTVAILLRTELDSRGLTNVKICGPGLAILGNAPSWFNALDATGVASLGAWSTHAWDEGWGHTDAMPSYLDSRYKIYFDPYVLAKDPNRTKPVIITEYATGVLTYNGVTFTSDEAYDSNQFAERVYENTLTLINNGANILAYWQAADHDWMTQGTSGFMRKQSSGSTLRPVYYAMTTLMPLIPDGASVLTKTWNDSNISAAGFIGTDKFVAAFANSTAATVSRTIKIMGVTSFSIIEAKAFINGSVVDKLADLNFDYETSTFDITLPRESTLTVVASVNECSSRLLGDLNADCKIAFDDYAIIAKDWLKDNRGPAATIVDNFENYADTIGILNKWLVSPNVIVTLETTIVHSGAKALKGVFMCGTSPYYAKAGLVLNGGAGADWSSYTTLTFWAKMGAVSNDQFTVDIRDQYGGRLKQYTFGSQKSHQNGLWYQLTCDLTQIADRRFVGRIDFAFLASDYSTNNAYFDDIAVNSGAVACQGEIVGDVNQDCVVDLSDILVFSEHWLECTMLPQGACSE